MPSSDDDPDATAWGAILPNGAVAAETPEGKTLVQLLASPPELDRIKCLLKDQVKYEGVPVTPPSRRDARDRSLFYAQCKTEAAMNKLVELLEKNNLQCTLEAAAILRSLQEDLLQQRRRLGAGKQCWKLDARPDSSAFRLYTKEEEKELKKKGWNQKGQAKNSNQSNNYNSKSGNFVFQRGRPSSSNQQQNQSGGRGGRKGGANRSRSANRGQGN